MVKINKCCVFVIIMMVLLLYYIFACFFFTYYSSTSLNSIYNVGSSRAMWQYIDKANYDVDTT